jgi:hypothetical protein
MGRCPYLFFKEEKIQLCVTLYFCLLAEEDEDTNSNESPVTLSFAWHPTEESVLMAIGREGKLAECNVPG